MKLLAVASAFEPCSVALWQDGMVDERYHAGPRGHAEHLLPFVEDLLGTADVTLADLDGIAFSRGPGSFTSLRIGIGVVQGLAWGAGLPVWPVSSLRIVAQGVLGAGVARAVVAMDARMDEVFSGCFEASGGVMMPAGPERVGPAEAILPGEPQGWTGVGNGFERFEVLAKAPLEALHPAAVPRASVLAALAAAEWKDDATLPADRAQPIYLRDRVAEKPARRSQGPGS